MFCLGCGYDLRGSTNACPECGRRFDPAKRGTFAHSPGRHRVRKGARFIARWSFRFIVLALVTLAVLRFGNPQWSRWIYIFQAFVSPAPDDHLLLPPDDFTGTWEVWGWNGTLVNEFPIEDGKLHGKVDGILHGRLIWNWDVESEDDDLNWWHWFSGRGHVERGRREGLWVVHGPKYGNPIKGYYRNGKRDGPWIIGETINHGRFILFYHDGKVGKRVDYDVGILTGFDLDAEDWPEIYRRP